MRIPYDPEGYSVDRDSGTIHTRYARGHAPKAERTRTVKGVETLLGETTPLPCSECYPHPIYKAPSVPSPSAPQQRRTGPGIESPHYPPA